MHFLVQSEFADLLQGLEYIHNVIPHQRRPALRGYLRTGRRLRQLAPEIAVDLQGNWKSAGLLRLSGAPRRIGAPPTERRERSSSWLLNEFSAKSERAHPYKQAQAMLGLLSPNLPALPPRLQASEAEIAGEAAALVGIGIDPNRAFRILVASDASDPRAWPASAMQREAQDSAMPLVYLRGPAESSWEMEDGSRILTHAPGELRRLVALAILVARVGGEVLGPDRGATHVLAAGGAETLVFCGPQDPRLTAPPFAMALRAQQAPDCVPCRKRVCQHPEGPVCMNFIRTEAELLGQVK